MAQLTVADAGRLVHAGACLQAHDTLAFVLELDPALEDVDQLEFGVVPVRLAGKLSAGRCADDMGIDAALGGGLDAEVAAFEEGAQAAFEFGVGGVVRYKRFGFY